jgi:hypothetical protein
MVEPEELTDLFLAGPPKTVYPNDATILAPEGVFPSQAIVIPQGFLIGAPVLPGGRLTAINMDYPARTEYIIHESEENPPFSWMNPWDPDNMPRFYHSVLFYDLGNDGWLDIVTVRSGLLRVGCNFYPPHGELVWFKNPGDDLDATMEWEETILFGGPLDGFLGPDIYIAMHDFDGDGVLEFKGTHFFTNPGVDITDTAATGKITLYATPEGSDWSVVNALDPDPNAPRARVKDLVTDQGTPFSVEVVDLNGDGQVDILATNHATATSVIPGRVFALERPASGNIFDDWTTHILLDEIRPAPFHPGANPMAPGHASAIYPFCGEGKTRRTKKESKKVSKKESVKKNKKESKEQKRIGYKPWIIVSGDEAAKVWLLEPIKDQEWAYTPRVIFDINGFYGNGTAETPLDDPFVITITTNGKPAVADDKKNKGIGSRETRDCFPWVLSRIVIGYICIWRLWLDVIVVQKLPTPIFISLLAMESVSLIVLWNKRIIPWSKD